MRERLQRPRVACAALFALTVVLGLGSRRYAAALPELVGEYAGDTLWATAVYWLGAILLPRARTAAHAAGAFGFALLIEVSQLYHAPWIDAVRATRPGALVLGYGFLWSDLVCYAAGVALAVAVDVLLVRRRWAADHA